MVFTVNGSKPRAVMAHVFAASCTGLQRLSEEVGRPLCLVDAVLDVEEAIHGLSRHHHGSGVRRSGRFRPFNLQCGWNDWSRFNLGSHGLSSTSLEASVQDGCIVVPLPDGLTVPEYRCQLAGALRHLRLQEVTISAAYLQERCEACAEMVVHPRYTVPGLAAAHGDFSGAALCKDLYAIDAAQHARRIYWIAVAARAAAGESRSTFWR